jgi:hypothetical protein
MLSTILQESPTGMDIFVNLFGDSAAWLLIFAGFMAFIWMLSEGFRRGGFLRPKKEEAIHDEISTVLRIIVYIGIVLGIISVITGVVTIMLKLPPSNAYAAQYGNTYDVLTSASLIIMGFAMFLKPMKDIPWAGLIGCVAGGLAGVIVVLSIPENWILALGLVTDWNMKYFLIVIFCVIATLTGILVKYWFSGIEMLSRFLSWPPVALIAGIYCLIQGFNVLIFGNTLYFITI